MDLFRARRERVGLGPERHMAPTPWHNRASGSGPNGGGTRADKGSQDRAKPALRPRGIAKKPKPGLFLESSLVRLVPEADEQQWGGGASPRRGSSLEYE